MSAARALRFATLAALLLVALAAHAPAHRHRRQLDLADPLDLQSGRGSRAPARWKRQVATYPDGVPMFDRNKVSLDFPGSLFGPAVSLVIKSTKVIGDVVQNSAERYRTFLRLFRPLFRGPFELKGLDPPTTTTTTTTTRKPTTSTTSAPSAENEVRRRRR